MIEQFLAARKVSTPIVLIRSTDYTLTTRAIKTALEVKDKASKKSKGDPIITWDCVNGWMPMNDAAKEACAKFGSAEDLKSKTTNAVESVELAQQLPARSVLFLYNAHQGFDNPNWIQACWNLRDSYKINTRQLVMLTISGTNLPPELASDVMVIDEPLPTRKQLEGVVKACFESLPDGETSALDDDLMAKSVEALSGLAVFPSEQVTSMSFTRAADKRITLNLDSLWTRKKSMVDSVPGLSIYKGIEKFADIGGLDSIKSFLKRFIKGRRPPRVVVFMDEIEKMMGGSDTDSSGTTQAQLGKLLSWTQERNENGFVKVNGILLLGHAGTGKSIISKATGNEAGCPTVSCDLGSVKSSLVGSSEARMDQMLKVIDAIGQGEILLMATCNKIDNLKPEFRARFQLATWMFDLPTAEERKTIWDIHRKRFEINPEMEQPQDDGWVGREIESCCQLAYLLNISLIEAAMYITPSHKASAEAIANLRERANGRYLSASHAGPYFNKMTETATGASRAIEFE